MVQVADATTAQELANTVCQGCGQSALNHQCGTVIVSSSYRRANYVAVNASNGVVPIATECSDCGGPLHYKYSKNETRFSCSWRQYETDRGNTGFPWTPKTPSIAFSEQTVMDYANWMLANPNAGKGAMHSGDAKKQQAAAQAAWNQANGVAAPVVAKPRTPAQMKAAGIAAPAAQGVATQQGGPAGSVAYVPDPNATFDADGNRILGSMKTLPEVIAKMKAEVASEAGVKPEDVTVEVVPAGGLTQEQRKKLLRGKK